MSAKPSFATPDAEAIYRLRWTELGLSQRAFADRFGIPYATVQNIEQGRGAPKPLALLVLAAIELDPDLMARAAASVAAERSASVAVEVKMTPSADSDERRFALPGPLGIRLIRRPAHIVPAEGTIAMVHGDGWDSAGWYRDGHWTNGRNQPLKREPKFWTVIEGAEGASK